MAILAVVLTLVSVNSGGSVVVWRGDGHVDLCGVWCGYRRGGSEMWWVDIRRGGDGWWWAYWSDDTGLRWIGELTMTDSGWIEHGWWVDGSGDGIMRWTKMNSCPLVMGCGGYVMGCCR